MGTLKIAWLLSVVLTCYHATESECDGSPLRTACGAKIESESTAYNHRYIALSRDLLEEYPYGTTVIVSGCSIAEYNGKWTVADCMAKRWKQMCDVLINPGMKLTKERVRIEKYNGPEYLVRFPIKWFGKDYNIPNEILTFGP